MDFTYIIPSFLALGNSDNYISNDSGLFHIVKEAVDKSTASGFRKHLYLTPAISRRPGFYFQSARSIRVISIVTSVV